MEGHLVGEVDERTRALEGSKVTQLERTRACVVMNTTESHQLGESCDTEDVEGSCRVSRAVQRKAAMWV